MRNKIKHKMDTMNERKKNQQQPTRLYAFRFDNIFFFLNTKIRTSFKSNIIEHNIIKKIQLENIVHTTNYLPIIRIF